MFLAARWRLTGVFTAILVVILIASGAIVYITTRSLIYDRVDAELADKAEEESFLATRDRPDHGPGPGYGGDGPSQEQFDQGGYFYAVTDVEGEVLDNSDNLKEGCLAGKSTLEAAMSSDEGTYTETESTDGATQRVFVVSATDPNGAAVLFQVGRSIEPELSTLEQLRNILLAVVAISAIPALFGGYLISGRVLRPIKSAIDSQRAFIADASHELRTPVAVVRTNAEILERHLQSGTIGRETDSIAIEDILSESERLGRMVSQMLTLAQADAGQVTFVPAAMSLSELAEAVTRSMRALATAKRIDLNARIEPSLTVNGDAERLREVLVTLLDNAIKYTDERGRIDMNAARSGRKAIVTIADTGVGIPPDALPHIFERFYRVDKARTRETGGTGLGLAIARHIVESHDGTLRIESEPGKGTKVTVELRLTGETPREASPDRDFP